MRVEKTRKDFYSLKEQRAEKRHKDEIAFWEQIEKASADYVSMFFLYEQYTQGECWKIVEVKCGLIVIPTKTGKVKELKNQIIMCVKVLR